MIFAGRKSPAGGFKPGTYSATMTITRKDAVVFQKSWQTKVE
jgi:hypothetical protein